jgi:hypothetical protein
LPSTFDFPPLCLALYYSPQSAVSAQEGCRWSLFDTRIAKLTDSTDNLTRSLTDLLDGRTSGMVSCLAARRGR